MFCRLQLLKKTPLLAEKKIHKELRKNEQQVMLEEEWHWVNFWLLQGEKFSSKCFHLLTLAQSVVAVTFN